MLNRLNLEPVAISGLVRAIILCTTAFGLDLSVDQIAGIMLVTEAVLSVVVRARVVPLYPADVAGE